MREEITHDQLRGSSRAWSCTKDGSDSDPWNDVSYQVGVDPIDDAGIDISHLEQRWNLGVSGTAADTLSRSVEEPLDLTHPIAGGNTDCTVAGGVAEMIVRLYAPLNTCVHVSSLLCNRRELNSPVDHREGGQYGIKVGVDEVSGFAH